MARRVRSALVGWLLVAVVVFATTPAMADRNTEAAAKAAMTAALKDHQAGDDDGAVLRLQRARSACGSGRCSAGIRAMILRDLGAVTFLRGDHAKASALFGEALDLVPNLAWNPNFDPVEVVTEFAAVKNERAAIHERRFEGDFEHVPEAEQAVNTPLPIYAELNMPGVAKVVVKYKVPGSDEFKRRTLPRFGGGWGGTIPCADVKRGLLRYFLQAFDADGVPLANSGDVKHLYFVPIRWAILGEPPHLPGQSPPETCTAGAPPEPETPEQAAGPSTGTVARYVRLWFGVSGSIDLTLIPSGTDVCGGSSFFCTTTDESTFPGKLKAAKGGAGDSPGGPATGDMRALFTFDYALSTHFLMGGRVGWVAESYPGSPPAGHAISTPLHIELRATYLFGDEPLAHAGFAPYGFAAAGFAKTDAMQVSSAQFVGVEGTRPIDVWKTGGPVFAAVGGGARYAFSPRVAFLAGLKAAVAFGPAGFMPILAPEATLQYGF